MRSNWKILSGVSTYQKIRISVSTASESVTGALRMKMGTKKDAPNQAHDISWTAIDASTFGETMDIYVFQ